MPEHAVDCDVLVCADDPRGDGAGAAAWSGSSACARFDAGPLRNAVALESLTPVLLHLGKRYKASGIGMRFTGLG